MITGLRFGFALPLILAAATASAQPAAAQPASARPASAPPTSQPSPSLRDRLLAQGGPSVALLVQPGGLLAMSPDGSFSESLLQGEIGGAALDARLDLVWALRGDTLVVVDLRAPAAEAVPIASGLPAGCRVSIDSSDGNAVTVGSAYSNLYADLTWSEQPALTAGADIPDLADPAALDAAQTATLVGQAWLLAQRGRPAQASRQTFAFQDIVGAPLPPETTDSCPGDSPCGTAVPFGRTGWLLRITDFSCGDWCYSSCQLYDPSTQQYAQVEAATTPAAPSWGAFHMEANGSCGPFYQGPSSTVLLTPDGAFCQLPSGACSASMGVPLGFLEGGGLVGMAP
jgi:hypothetical protein